MRLVIEKAAKRYVKTEESFIKSWSKWTELSEFTAEQLAGDEIEFSNAAVDAIDPTETLKKCKTKFQEFAEKYTEVYHGMEPLDLDFLILSAGLH